VGQVNANLVFATRVRSDHEEGRRYGDLPTHGRSREGTIGNSSCSGTTRPPTLFAVPEFGLGGSTIEPDTVFDGNLAGIVFAEWCVDDAVVVANKAVDEGDIVFFDLAVFPNSPQFASGGFGFGNEGDAAGFAVKSVDQLRVRALSEVKSCAAYEAGVLVGLGGMADEIRRLVNDKQVVILENHVEQVTHWSDYFTKRRMRG